MKQIEVSKPGVRRALARVVTKAWVRWTFVLAVCGALLAPLHVAHGVPGAAWPVASDDFTHRKDPKPRVASDDFTHRPQPPIAHG